MHHVHPHEALVRGVSKESVTRTDSNLNFDVDANLPILSLQRSFLSSPLGLGRLEDGPAFWLFGYPGDVFLQYLSKTLFISELIRLRRCDEEERSTTKSFAALPFSLQTQIYCRPIDPDDLSLEEISKHLETVLMSLETRLRSK